MPYLLKVLGCILPCETRLNTVLTSFRQALHIEQNSSSQTLPGPLQLLIVKGHKHASVHHRYRKLSSRCHQNLSHYLYSEKFTCVRYNYVKTAWMFVQKVCDIVDSPADCNPAVIFCCVLLKVFHRIQFRRLDLCHHKRGTCPPKAGSMQIFIARAVRCSARNSLKQVAATLAGFQRKQRKEARHRQPLVNRPCGGVDLVTK